MSTTSDVGEPLRPPHLDELAITTLPDGTIRNGGVSHWLQQAGVPTQRAPLPGDIDVDIAIVGGGMTGLWTAYYLKKADPGLRVAIVESQFVGFGASGRNGGWLSAEPPGLFRHYADDAGTSAATALQQHMFQTIDEVLGVLDTERIEADAVKNGLVYVATNPAQQQRLRTRFDRLHQQGWQADDLQWLGGHEVSERVRVTGARAGYATPHCARVDPAKLTIGLGHAVEGLGVTIYEGTTATDIQPRQVVTDCGTVRADVVVRALEGYTGSLRGERRTFLPLNSSIVITDPLGPEVWEQIGWRDSCLLGDGGNSYAYMQRTADDRIAMGGRGVPYHFGSRFDPAGRTATKAILQLRDHMRRLFPVTESVDLHHTWSGVLGVARDWCASINYAPASGLISAGGYAGHGVAGTNLAGRTVRDLVLQVDSDLAAMPWVSHRCRRWEPEPLRWLGASSVYTAYRYADWRERRSTSRSHVGQIADLVSGRH